MRQIMRFFKGRTKGPVVAPESVENPPIPYVENGDEVRKNGCDENGEEGPKNGCVENAEEALNALTSKSVENPPKPQVENGEEGKKNGHALTAKSVENSSSSEVEKSEKEKKNGHVASMENQPTPEAENAEAKKPAHSESKPTNGTALNAPVSPPKTKKGSQDKNEDLLEAAEGLGNPLKPEEELELASKLSTAYLGRGDEVQPVQRFTVNAFGVKPPQVEPFGKMTVRQLITLTLNDPKFKAELKELITEPPPSDQTDQCNDPCSS